MLDAISILCAERAGASYISKGKEKAIIEGTFDLSQNKHALEIMADAGLETNEDVTFTRELLSSGKSVIRIDHRIVTLSLAKDILRDEIDIHGQRDTAYLLNTTNHIRLLDTFLQVDEELQQVKDSYQCYSKLLKEKEKALQNEFNENDLEYFQYQIQEIEQADLKIGEDEELAEKERQYKQIKNSLDKYNQVFSLYENGLADSLYDLQKLCLNLGSDEKTTTIQTSISDAYYSISDSIDELHKLVGEYDMDEEEINEMEERLFTIQKLKRKYGNSIEQILAQQEQLKQQVQMFTHRKEFIEQMDQKISTALITYQEYASKLSKIRRTRANELDDAILINLKELMLPNACFKTVFTDCKPSEHGNENVEFMIAMNKGEEPKSLVKTASGGELSRLMLGLKVIFTKLQGIQTVIFDEIDTGVSGPVATAIGQKMKALSKSCQVFAVTHLAQVAACADTHYFVSKEDQDNKTITHVSELDETGRINQLALISSGSITDISTKAAQELYRRNHS
ncbi:MAG: DNA repair protein RecN [Solobacterium sp.]|nr:DNA repair protein RecN [Solobacterium sp.]